MSHIFFAPLQLRVTKRCTIPDHYSLIPLVLNKPHKFTFFTFFYLFHLFYMKRTGQVCTISFHRFLFDANNVTLLPSYCEMREKCIMPVRHRAARKHSQHTQDGRNLRACFVRSPDRSHIPLFSCTCRIVRHSRLGCETKKRNAKPDIIRTGSPASSDWLATQARRSHFPRSTRVGSQQGECALYSLVDLLSDCVFAVAATTPLQSLTAHETLTLAISTNELRRRNSNSNSKATGS